MRRTLVFAVALLAGLTAATAAQASGFDPNDIAFPVDGEHRLTNNFGDCRGTDCSRLHEGEDIMVAKGVPVVAAADGVATWVSQTQAECCRLQIDHGDGWATRYIHLNNDTQNPDGTYTDDDQGWGIADGITNGTLIRKGQLIGWVGDSGNAKGGAPHLHFEIRKDGVAAWDLTFSADKSVSLLWALGHTEVRRHVVESFEEATVEALTYLESVASSTRGASRRSTPCATRSWQKRGRAAWRSCPPTKTCIRCSSAYSPNVWAMSGSASMRDAAVTIWSLQTCGSSAATGRVLWAIRSRSSWKRSRAWRNSTSKP